MGAKTDSGTDAGYAIVDPDAVDDAYAGSDVPGEFRSLTDAPGIRAACSHPDSGACPL